MFDKIFHSKSEAVKDFLMCGDFSARVFLLKLILGLISSVA